MAALNSSKKGSKMSNYENESPIIGTRGKTDLQAIDEYNKNQPKLSPTRGNL